MTQAQAEWLLIALIAAGMLAYIAYTLWEAS